MLRLFKNVQSWDDCEWWNHSLGRFARMVSLLCRRDFSHSKLLRPRSVCKFKCSLMFQKSLSLHNCNCETARKTLFRDSKVSQAFSLFHIKLISGSCLMKCLFLQSRVLKMKLNPHEAHSAFFFFFFFCQKEHWGPTKQTCLVRQLPGRRLHLISWVQDFTSEEEKVFHFRVVILTLQWIQCESKNKSEASLRMSFYFLYFSVRLL